MLPGHVYMNLVYSILSTSSFFFFFFFLSLLSFLGRHPWHMEVPRLGVKSELQLLAYTIAIVMRDLSCSCQIHNPLSEARDRTLILVDASRVH